MITTLKNRHPELSKYWNNERNSKLGLFFDKIAPNSHKKVWWRCEKGHEYEASPHQVSRGGGCPYCSSERILVGFNDLATTRRDLLLWWNYKKNTQLKPIDIMARSNKKVWWKCPNGHEWEATPNSISRGSRCPYCNNHKVLPGYNDLATLNPQLADEWNHEKNGNLKPQDFMAGSGKKVWWKCKNGHEWEATILSRNRGNGCPHCSKEKFIKH